MGSIPVGSTKKQTQTCLLLLSLRRIERLLTQPDSRALDKLADEREHQKADTEVSAFAIPTWNRMAVDTARFPYARQARCYTGVPKQL